MIGCDIWERRRGRPSNHDPAGRLSPVARLAVISYHTSPLAQPGTGDGGGMNVYVRELSSGLARLGHEVDVYTRRDNTPVRDAVEVEPGFRVHYVRAGPAAPLDREGLTNHVA